MGKDDLNIAIAYAYGPRNSGDFALNLGAINIISNIVKKENINFISRFSKISNYYKMTKDMLNYYEPKINLHPCFFDVDKYRQNKIQRYAKIISTSINYSFNHLLPYKILKKGNSGLKSIFTSDLVLCNGGNLFYWNKYRSSLSYFLGVLYPFTMAKKIKKPYGFLPQSIGEINGLGKLIINDVFKKAEFVTFRENISKDIFYKSFELEYPTYIDLAFFIDRYEDKKANDILDECLIKSKDFIALNIRSGKLGDTGNLDNQKIKYISKFLRGLIEKLLNNYDYNILLIIQNKIDYHLSNKIFKLFINTNRVKIIEEYNPIILRSIYKKSIISITMRLHASIFALSSGVPTIGIFDSQWGPKMPGTFSNLGFSNSVFNLSDLNLEKIISQIDKNINESKEIKEYTIKLIQKNKIKLVNYLSERIKEINTNQ